MKLSDKIAAAHGKGGDWYSHARHLEAQLEGERAESAELAELAANQRDTIADLKRDLEQARRRLPDIRPALGLVDPEVVAILIAVMKKAGVDHVMVDPRRAWLSHGEHTGDTIQVERSPADGTLILTLKARPGLALPDGPCTAEHRDTHEWYLEPDGGAVCRACGLQTVRKGGDLELPPEGAVRS